jgi:hypothetical protein
VKYVLVYYAELRKGCSPAYLEKAKARRCVH